MTKLQHKIGILGCLYVAQFLPGSFLLQTVPTFMRQQGDSVQAIGLMSLLALPAILKFIWSPLVDRYPLARIGHYKSWILAMQALTSAILIACTRLNFQNQFVPLLLAMLLVITCSSIQDIAIDALAIGILAPHERGLGNGIQVGGNYLGALLGGGVLLALLESWGWGETLLAMAGFTVLLMVPVLLHREQKRAIAPKNAKTNPIVAYWQTFSRFFQRPGIGAWSCLLLFYFAGVSMTSTMFRPLLVDLGLSLSQIGLLNGTVAFSAGFVGAGLGGSLVKPLGRRRSLISFSLLLVGAIVVHLLPALGFTRLPFLYLAAILLNFTYSMTAVALNAIMMDKSHLETAGSDYTLQTSILFLGSIFAGGASGFLVEAIGYGGVFVLSGVVSLVCIVPVVTTFTQIGNFEGAGRSQEG
ncbi:MAG: MFS transporter [Cyanobacteria bacterium P01_E01_bin.42]